VQNPRISKVIAGMTVLAVLAGIVLHFSNRGRQQTPAQPLPAQLAGSEARRATPHRNRDPEAAAIEGETQELAAVDFDWRQALTNHARLPKLPREEVEKYLEQNRRSAVSLLAAYGALRDTNYLKEAATNFPNDPRVQLSVLRRDVFPEERRKWLDLFKASSPDNSLANYFSARDYFKNGQSEPAVNELLEAAGKPAFKDYVMEFKLDEEELSLAAGRSSLQARLSSSGWAEDLMPQLASLKALAQDVAALQRQYSSTGDNASVEHLAQMGLSLADKLDTGDGARIVLNQLVGRAIEAIMLKQLDPNASYDFLGGKTPEDRLAALKEQKASIDSLRQTFLETIPNMTEAELLNYTERQRLYGQAEAMRWLQRRSAAGASERPQ